MIMIMIWNVVKSDKFIFNYYGNLNNFDGNIVQITQNTDDGVVYFLSPTPMKAYTNCYNYSALSYSTPSRQDCGSCTILPDTVIGDFDASDVLQPSMLPLCYIVRVSQTTNYRVVALNFLDGYNQTVEASANPYCNMTCGANCCGSNSVVATLSLNN